MVYNSICCTQKKSSKFTRNLNRFPITSIDLFSIQLTQMTNDFFSSNKKYSLFNLNFYFEMNAVKSISSNECQSNSTINKLLKLAFRMLDGRNAYKDNISCDKLLSRRSWRKIKCFALCENDTKKRIVGEETNHIDNFHFFRFPYLHGSSQNKIE